MNTLPKTVSARDNDVEQLPPLDWRSWLTLALFLVVTVFVVHPIHIPVPVPSALRPLKWRKGRISMDLKLAPWAAICLLLATTAIRIKSEVYHGFIGSDGIEPYGIVILIMSLAYICISLDQSGVLSYIAMYVTKKWGRNGRLLLLCFYALSAVMAVLTSNDVVVLCLTPIICIFSDITGVDAEPFLISMFVSANTASMALYIGNPTNIVAAQANKISFLVYSAWMVLPFLGAAVTGCIVLYLTSLRKVPRTITVTIDIYPRSMLVRPKQAIFGSVLLVLCLVALSVSSFFGVAVWMVTLPFGGFMLIVDTVVDLYSTSRMPASKSASDLDAARKTLSGSDNIEIKNILEPSNPEPVLSSVGISTVSSETADQEECKPDRHISKSIDKLQLIMEQRLPTVTAVLYRLPYGIVPFSLGMFIIVESLSELGWTPRLAWLLKKVCPSVVPAVFIVGLMTTLACNVLNNLPMTILFTRALKHSIFMQIDQQTRKGALFALIVGSNLGANLTLVGSLAGLMFQGIAAQKNRNIGYFKFMRWCLPVLPVQLAACCAILAAEMVIIK
ncbi:hypothetical protein J3B02_000389 [Coemansia erecta]|uniref:Citrate transporter-like domain-containing protein n=1 Tax=Coemansia asiatica TaxID=1052880 RepID=A0A9W7XQI0_9FUNG|nr:hypothetical protein LPJ64_001204 [Coemansia asiatica]KAJ2858254.1 hypothetical protein J3B02_000389 [Coemansia erecta]KAJ2889161.1 hypothetical protein FB639_000107 [Coemansia asiatica]